MNLEIKNAQKKKPEAINRNYKTSKECFLWLRDGRLTRAKYNHKDQLWVSKGLGYIEVKQVGYYFEIPTIQELDG